MFMMNVINPISHPSPSPLCAWRLLRCIPKNNLTPPELLWETGAPFFSSSSLNENERWWNVFVVYDLSERPTYKQ